MDGDKNSIAEILKEATQGMLSEESLTAIQTAFNETVKQRTSLNVEAALLKQDEEHAVQLKKLIEAIDADRAAKLVHVVKAIDSNNAKKLQNVVKKYKSALTLEANQFKKSLVRSISKYLNVYLEQAIPQNFINEAVLERKAQTVLENLRQHLAIDSSLMKESVRTAVVDGKKQIDEAHIELEKAQQRVKMLEEKLDRAQASVVFAEKTATLPPKKRDYVKKVLAGKSSKFILENIDYTINLFDKTEQEQVDFLKEQAMKDIVAVDDAPQNEKEEVVTESISDDNSTSSYLSELSKY